MAESLITQHIDLWTSAIEAKSTAGRGSKNKFDLYGIKKLRELILELAVRGKLVPQNQSDEPASILVDKIISIQNTLKTSEGLKTDASLTIKNDEYLIEIPNGWSLCRLGNLAKFIDYRGKTPNKVSSGVRLITAKNIKFGFISKSPEEYISQEDYSTWMTRGFPRVNDILFTTEAPLGNVAIIDIEDKFALAQRAICFQFHEPKISKFMLFQLMSPYFQKSIYDKQSGMTALGIKASRLKEIVIILPPLAEQHRIVAKVDELMALCDQLEQQTLTSIDAHATLVETLLETLTNSADATELEQNWARISEHFDTLFITEQSIDALKQTILQLAVMGKLVRQDPTDEPASVLLEKIAAEKAQLIKDKKIKKEKPLPPITDEEKPYELPQGWKWCRVSHLMNNMRDISYGIIKLEQEPDVDGVPTLRCSDIKSGYIDLTGVRTVHPEIEKVYHRTRLQGGEVLVNIRGTLGGVALVPKKLAGFNIAREVAMLPIHNSISGEYLVQLIASPFFWKKIEENLKGIAYKGLNLNNLRDLVMPIPPVAEQNKIADKTIYLLELCEQLKKHLQLLRKTQLYLTDTIIGEEFK
ncbi:restriction endonuclease subunit S [uncultured Tolumonas sp.]|uniref:restriction endonuclease subunit S n=1 Tax=uncultured Tolumonas sp. TaxID=263765 RepID=UPI00292DD1C6|nr:restriction endonuclease subunit S [uncultured Tolumonas sp.]